MPPGRNPGKFKTKRGGGRSFSKNLTLDENGIATDKSTLHKSSDDDIDEEDEDEDEDSSDEDAATGIPAGGTSQPQPILSRAERKEKKKEKKQAAKGDEDDEDADLINPNHASLKTLSISDIGKVREPTRREREQQEKKDAQERYWKLHREGKTDQAKADLARLNKIRQEREEAMAKRKAEADAKAAEIEAKKAAQTGRKAA